MPYKDKESRKEASRKSMEKERQGLTTGVNKEGVNIETVPASYIQGNKGRHEFLPERPRYLTLSDGQVLDRLNQPTATKELPGMRAANDSYSGIIRQEPGILDALTDPAKRKKLEKIHQSLKDFKVSKEVRYGVSGPTFDVVGEMLDATR